MDNNNRVVSMGNITKFYNKYNEIIAVATREKIYLKWRAMSRYKIINGVPKELESEYLKCAICIENKMHNLPFKNNRTRAEDILEIVYTDLNGSHTTVGYRVEKYFISFVDDYSKLSKVYCVKSKDQVYDCFLKYINEVENLAGKKIRRLRCNNGKEYLNLKIYKLVREKGIQINACPPYVHELNGTAEV